MRARSIWRSAICVIAVLATGHPIAAKQLRSLSPTPLEAFVAQPGARTVWSKYLGRLDGRTASAIVTAIAVEAGGSPRAIMRGVRIELRHEGATPSCDQKHVEWSIMCARENAAIYFEESRLDSVRTTVLTGPVEVHAGHAVSITTFGGTNGPGLLITGFLLYNRTPEELAAMLAAGVKELQNAPRTSAR